VEWSEKFETKISFVDHQHKEIFALLDELSQCCKTHIVKKETVSNAIALLNAYSQKHFMAEEAWMARLCLDQRHIRAHRMEHSSFIYDVERLSFYTETPDNLLETTEKLVDFVTHWWSYHILCVDRSMSIQLIAINKGKSPEEAYELALRFKQDPNVTHLMLDAVIELWRSATERCHALENELAKFKRQVDE
jgi:hemerythrin-like metal-binding protein